jgi:hypothetical protein
MAVVTGGFSVDELLGAGAARVFDSLPELQQGILGSADGKERKQRGRA